MYIPVNSLEILKLHNHIINKLSTSDKFKVVISDDINILLYISKFYEDNFVYQVVFKTKNVNIIKYFDDSIYDIVFYDNINQYEELLLDNIEKFNIDISKSKNKRLFSDYNYLERYICNIYLYIFDNKY